MTYPNRPLFMKSIFWFVCDNSFAPHQNNANTSCTIMYVEDSMIGYCCAPVASNSQETKAPIGVAQVVSHLFMPHNSVSDVSIRISPSRTLTKGRIVSGWLCLL